MGSGDGSPPAESRGRAPVRGLGTKSPEAKEFLKWLQANFTYFLIFFFHTFSPIYAYVFSVLAGIIPLSLRNGGHLISFDPPCLQVGATAPSAPPAPPPMIFTGRMFFLSHN